jgi:hypothetical protein
MALWGPAEYAVVRTLLHRGLALIYLLAFLVAAFQFRPLAGEDGLLPLSQYVEHVDFRERPSLFHLVPDDRVVGVAAWAGVALAALALLGIPDGFGYGTTMVVWALMWALYLSFVNAGQLFYGYGWESMLLEAGFLAVFLGGGGGVAPPEVVVWLFRWLLFRNLFGAGLIKIRGDDCWRELTCLEYHYKNGHGNGNPSTTAGASKPGAGARRWAPDTTWKSVLVRYFSGRMPAGRPNASAGPETEMVGA